MKATMLARVQATTKAVPDGGLRYEFPQLPPGTQQQTLGKNPLAKNADQIWLLVGDAIMLPTGISTPLQQFATMPGVMKLSQEEALLVGRQWSPQFDPPQYLINLL